jgi:cytochrome b6
MFTTLKLVPAHVFTIEGEVLAVMGFILGGLLLLLVPFLDRRAAREKRSPVFSAIGLAIVLYIIIMTGLTYLSPNLGK